MTTATAPQSRALPQLIRCGKGELLLNFAHVFGIAFIFLLGFVVTPATNFTLLFLNASVFIVIAIWVRKSGPIHLDLIFLFFLFLYSFSVPFSNALAEREYNQEVLRYSTDICMLAYFGFAIGLLLDSGRHRMNAPLSSIGPVEAERMRKAGMLVFLLGAIASVAAIALTTGMSAYLSAGYAGRALLKRDVGPVELGLYVSVVGLFAVFAATILAEKRRQLSKLFIGFVFLFFFFYISFLGIRRPLFLLGVGLLSGYSLIRHRPRFAVAMPIGVVAFAFLTTFAQYRQLISTVGISATIDFIQDNASAEWIDVSNTELGAPFRTLVDYLGNESQAGELLLGSSYLESIPYTLPSFITGGMQSLSVKYTYHFFSSDFISIGGNMGLFPVTEAYLNFGVVGAFAIFLLFGFLLSRSNRWFHRVGRGGATYIILFMMLVPWTAFFMRLDMASFFKGFLYSQLVPFLLLAALINLQKPLATRHA